ncbi:hypothetical protein GT030_05515 [Streptomyces sp. SID1328]|uniref:hypothetical protein n=1 Tax=Streptomyces sp. SID1328 TaxID=2690250 RepID=UPI0013716B3B|nr:hypothetical protein [Streptomyces sp. SID1328]MYV38339.1 hypothetical protein [Streptomyces sp. SID1328]
MIAYSDEGPDFEPDDPLVIMRPPHEHLAPPPGRYEEFRRGAARRRILRTAVIASATCAVGALLAVPFLRSAPQDRAPRTVPLAPPPASSPTVRPTPAESDPPNPSPRPDARSSTRTPTRPARPPAATPSPSAVPSSAVPSSTPTEHRPLLPTPRRRTAAPSTNPTRS